MISYWDSKDLVFGLSDIVIGLFVSLLVFLFCLCFSSLSYNQKLRNYFLLSVLIRVLFVFIFSYLTITQLGGDSIMYYHGGRQIAHSPLPVFFDFLTSIDYKGWSSANWEQFDGVTSAYMPTASNFLVSKTAAVILLACYDSYIATSVVFGFLGFIGFWKLFRIALNFFPSFHKSLALGILFFPSSIYWTSGIGKDALAIFGLGIFIEHALKVLHFKQLSFYSLLLIIFSGSLVLIIKSYIILFFTLAILFLGFYSFIRSIKNRNLLFVIYPFLLSSVLGLGLFVMKFITNLSFGKKYDPDVLLKGMADHKDSFENITSGSNFNLGAFDPSIIGLLKLFPKAINASLFRPYLWEAKSPVMFFIGLENLVVFSLVVILFCKSRFKNIYRVLRSNDYLVFCLFVTILFAGLIGISTSNFGSLSRYRLPCVPFFLTLLAVTYNWKKYRAKPNKFVS